MVATKLTILSDLPDLTTLERKLQRLLVLEKSEASLTSLGEGEASSNFTSTKMHEGKAKNNWQGRYQQHKKQNERADKWREADKSVADQTLFQECN